MSTREHQRAPAGPTSPAAETPSSRGRIKGLAFREFVVWYRANHGDAGLERALASPAVAGQWSIVPGHATLIGVLPSVWYETRRVGQFVEAILEQHDPRTRESILERGAEAIIQRTLRGAYRLLFDAIATPERYARFVTRLWLTYHDEGRIDATWSSPTSLRLEIRDWPGHHHAICRLTMYSTRYLLMEMGMDDVQIRRDGCVAEGQTSCSCTASFRRP